MGEGSDMIVVVLVDRVVRESSQGNRERESSTFLLSENLLEYLSLSSTTAYLHINSISSA